MTEKQSSRDRDPGRTDDRFDGPVSRRTFIAASSAVAGTALAGCTSNGTDRTADDPQTDGTTDGSGTDGGTEPTNGGNFRLLISDRPADIEDFDRLDVTLDYARIFDGGGDESEGEDDEKDGDEAEEDEKEGDAKESDAETTEAGSSEDENETEPDAESESDGETESESDETEAQSDADDVERTRGFYTLDLEGATVDLTDVIGDRAIPVFDGELSPGTYEKIELHVSAVEGIVDGERASVKVPSEKLQITHLIEIRADEPVDFVFDINVVKRGNGNEYNLKPVISESGVAGKDVAVEEVDEGRNRGGEDEDEDEDANDASESAESDSDEEDDADSDDSDTNGTE